MFDRRPMTLPALPDGLFWDLVDDGTDSRPYKWRVVKANGETFINGNWRNHAFDLGARFEVHWGAIIVRREIVKDKRKAEEKKQAHLAQQALAQRREVGRRAITAARDAEVREMARRRPW